MNGKLISIGGFVLGLGGGSMINYFYPQFLWLGWTLMGLGVIAIIVGIKWNWATRQWRRVKTIYTITLRISTKIKEANRLLLVKEQQQKNPVKWLYPVIDHIDLNRQGGDSTENDAFVRFKIDSHLLYPISEYYVFVKLCLRDESQSDFPETASIDRYEIEQGEHYEPIRQLECHHFAEKRMHFEAKTDEGKAKDSALLKMMENFRNGHRVLAMLKIEIALKKETKDNPILLEGSCWIAPMNNYRGG